MELNSSYHLELLTQNQKSTTEMCLLLWFRAVSCQGKHSFQRQSWGCWAGGSSDSESHPTHLKKLKLPRFSQVSLLKVIETVNNLGTGDSAEICL